METQDQAYMDCTEVEAAIEYAEIAANYNVPVTLFVTGKAAVEEPDRVERLAAMDNVEIGGHNYWAFDTPIHTAWRAVEKLSGGCIGSWNGPRPFQRHEIKRTITALTERGVDVATWRDHAYRYDQHTVELLTEMGITHFSDSVGPHQSVRQKKGLTVVPINTPPDHEHLYHAFRTPESQAVDQFVGPFGMESYEGKNWLKWVRNSVNSVTESEQIATILAHPSCMKLTDNFIIFEELCSFLSKNHDIQFLSKVECD
jgi:peptidoglycan/xylan/chitin deacetylase (PgdA/CDA1 family)